MSTANEFLILLLLTDYFEKNDLELAHKIADAKSDLIAINQIIGDARTSLFTIGNKAYMSEEYKEARKFHSELLARKTAILKEISDLDSEKSLSMDALVKVEMLIRGEVE